jgi:hypothetical protein
LTETGPEVIPSGSTALLPDRVSPGTCSNRALGEPTWTRIQAADKTPTTAEFDDGGTTAIAHAGSIPAERVGARPRWSLAEVVEVGDGVEEALVENRAFIQSCKWH